MELCSCRCIVRGSFGAAVATVLDGVVVVVGKLGSIKISMLSNASGTRALSTGETMYDCSWVR